MYFKENRSLSIASASEYCIFMFFGAVIPAILIIASLSGYESVEILHNGSPLKHPESCPRLIYTINSTTSMDDGLYICRGRLAGGSHETLLLGNMTTIGECIFYSSEHLVCGSSYHDS